MKITEYNLSTEYGLKIALLADLHEMSPDDAIETLKTTEPDLILVCGDTFEAYYDLEKAEEEKKKEKDKRTCIEWIKDGIYRIICRIGGWPRKKNPEAGYTFLQEAVKLAPVYISQGNHEDDIPEEYLKKVKEIGAIWLQNQNADFYIGRKVIHIGGLGNSPNRLWLEEFSEMEGMKILMCHRPEIYAWDIKDTDLDTADIVLAGHTHGGQWKLSGKAIYAPGQGLLPKYSNGQYGKMIISAGISNPVKIPRFNNPCEVVIINI